MNRLINYFWGAPTPTLQEPNALCLKGGGVKGFAFLGAAKAFKERNVTFSNFIGSSAGAIFAAAMACKIDLDKLERLVYTTDYTQFCDYNYGIVGKGYNLYEDMGIYKGAYFYNWLSDLLHQCTGNEKITFAEVAELYKTNLVITGTNLTRKKLEYFHAGTHPDMEIRDAIRISMSIPGYFCPVTHDNCVYVDGGCTNNFPINYFKNCIGINLTSSSMPVEINNTLELIDALVNTEIEENDRLRALENPTAKIINIDTSNVQSTNFAITHAQITELINNGYKATIKSNF
jgi:NTE family protein